MCWVLRVKESRCGFCPHGAYGLEGKPVTKQRIM